MGFIIEGKRAYLDLCEARNVLAYSEDQHVVFAKRSDAQNAIRRTKRKTNANEEFKIIQL